MVGQVAMGCCVVMLLMGTARGGGEDDHVLESLRPNLINHFTFDNPKDGDVKSPVELDLGSDKTNINLLNGAPRVEDGAWAGSKYSLETGQKNGKPNDDWKAGVMFKTSAESTLKGTKQIGGATIMGYFKPLGTVNDNPSVNTTTPNNGAKYNAFGLGGLLRGDDTVGNLDGHAVRALLEVINGKVSGLGRPLDGVSASGQRASVDDWNIVMPPNQWTHLAATFDFEKGTIVLYKNGKPLASSPANVASWQWKAGEKHVSSNTAAGGIKIGGSYPDNSQEKNPFNGRIDELMFFNKALTAEEVAGQYKLIAPATIMLPASAPATK